MGKVKLKPGQHGKIFVTQNGPKSWRARTRVCLLDGSEAWATASATSEDGARLNAQDAATAKINAARGSDELKPDSMVGLACRQWIAEKRVRATWPRPPMRPQTIDKYEYTLGEYAVPALGRRRLSELTPGESAWV